MAKVRQLIVPCENCPGSLAQVARVLGNAKVNILDFLTITFGTEGSVQFVADNANKAKKALEGAGLSYTEEAALQIELPNLPGALAGFAGKLAAREITITSGCLTSTKGSKKASLVLSVSDLEKAIRIR